MYDCKELNRQVFGCCRRLYGDMPCCKIIRSHNLTAFGHILH